MPEEPGNLFEFPTELAEINNEIRGIHELRKLGVRKIKNIPGRQPLANRKKN